MRPGVRAGPKRRGEENVQPEHRKIILKGRGRGPVREAGERTRPHISLSIRSPPHHAPRPARRLAAAAGSRTDPTQGRGCARAARAGLPAPRLGPRRRRVRVGRDALRRAPHLWIVAVTVGCKNRHGDRAARPAARCRRCIGDTSERHVTRGMGRGAGRFPFMSPDAKTSLAPARPPLCRSATDATVLAASWASETKQNEQGPWNYVWHPVLDLKLRARSITAWDCRHFRLTRPAGAAGPRRRSGSSAPAQAEGSGATLQSTVASPKRHLLVEERWISTLLPWEDPPMRRCEWRCHRDESNVQSPRDRAPIRQGSRVSAGERRGAREGRRLAGR
jgi:hypothetical protein